MEIITSRRSAKNWNSNLWLKINLAVMLSWYWRRCKKKSKEKTSNKIGWSYFRPLREKSPNVEFLLVRIFPYLDWIRENMDQKRLCIRTLFTQWTLSPKFCFHLWKSGEFIWQKQQFLKTIVLHQKENKYLAEASKSHAITNFVDGKPIKKLLQRRWKTVNLNHFTLLWLFLPSNPAIAIWACLRGGEGEGRLGLIRGEVDYYCQSFWAFSFSWTFYYRIITR